MTLVVLSGLSALLGASILAIALLTYWLRKTRADINRLHAELTATKIAALKTLSVTPSPREDPEPVRRKRHLALYIGGAVAAFFASVGDRLRSLVRGRRAAVVAAATSVLVAGSAAAYYASTDQAAPRPLAEPGASLMFPGGSGSGSGTQDPESGAPGGHHTDTTTDTSATGDDSDPSGAHLMLPGPAGVTGDGHRGGSGHGGQDRPGTPGKPSTPTPTPPGETKPPTPTPRPTPPPTPAPPTPPAPSEPPHTTPSPSDDRDLCVLPGMINLCVGSVIGVRP